MTRLGWIYLILVSILFGVAIGFSDIFIKILALIPIALCILTFLLIWLVDLFTKTSRWRSFFPFVFMACSVLIISILTQRITGMIKKRKADSIIQKIYEYKKINHRFPSTLSGITKDRKAKRYAYSYDSLDSEFELSYSIDGWSMHTFFSRDSIWAYHD